MLEANLRHGQCLAWGRPVPGYEILKGIPVAVVETWHSLYSPVGAQVPSCHSFTRPLRQLLASTFDGLLALEDCTRSKDDTQELCAPLTD